MLKEFQEACNSSHSDPLDTRIVEIDFESMDAQEIPINVLNVDDACEGLRVLAEYQIGQDCDHVAASRAFELIGRRVVALWWVHLPGLFDGAPSLTSLAKRTGIDESGLSRITAEITKAFGVRNRAQAHGDGRRGK